MNSAAPAAAACRPQPRRGRPPSAGIPPRTGPRSAGPRSCSSRTRRALPVSRPERRSAATKPSPTTRTVVRAVTRLSGRAPSSAERTLASGRGMASSPVNTTVWPNSGWPGSAAALGTRVGALPQASPDTERPGARAAAVPAGERVQRGHGGFGQRVQPRDRRPAGAERPGRGTDRVRRCSLAPLRRGDVDQDAGTGTGVLGGVVVVDQRHAGLLRGVGQRIGNQRVAAPGQHHRADVVVGRAGQARDLQAGADHAEVEGGVVGGQHVAADEGADLREQLAEAGQAGHLLGPDAVDPDVVVVEAVVVFRRPHQPGCLLDDDAAADLAQANGAR